MYVLHLVPVGAPHISRSLDVPSLPLPFVLFGSKTRLRRGLAGLGCPSLVHEKKEDTLAFAFTFVSLCMLTDIR